MPNYFNKGTKQAVCKGLWKLSAGKRENHKQIAWKGLYWEEGGGFQQDM